MSDVVPRPDPDETGQTLPEFNRVRDDGRALRRELRKRGGEADDELRERAKQVLEDAVAAGRITWDLAERDELDAIVMRAAAVLDGYDDVVIEPFRGDPPTFDEISLEEVAELVERGEPIVSRRLKELDLTRISLKRTKLLDCALHRCDLSGCDLSEARVLHSVFLNCEWSDANLTDAIITSSLLLGETDDQESPTSLAGVLAERANFSGSRVEGFSFDGAELGEALFSNSYLGKVRGGPDAKLRDVAFDYAAVDGFVAAGADLRGAMFIGSDLIRCDFADSDLSGAIFSSAKLGSSSFVAARFQETSFKSAYFVAQAKFDVRPEGAIFDRTDLEALERDWSRSQSDRA